MNINTQQVCASSIRSISCLMKLSAWIWLFNYGLPICQENKSTISALLQDDLFFSKNRFTHGISAMWHAIGFLHKTPINPVVIFHSGLHSCTACFSVKTRIFLAATLPFWLRSADGAVSVDYALSVQDGIQKTLPSPAAVDQEFMHGVEFESRPRTEAMLRNQTQFKRAVQTKIEIYSSFKSPSCHPKFIWLLLSLLWNSIKENTMFYSHMVHQGFSKMASSENF